MILSLYGGFTVYVSIAQVNMTMQLFHVNQAVRKANVNFKNKKQSKASSLSCEEAVDPHVSGRVACSYIEAALVLLSKLKI